MDDKGSTIALFKDHQAAEDAVKKLAANGFAMTSLSVVGKGYHSDEKVIGFFNTGDRVRFWGTRGAFWGGLWGLFFGGLFLSVPVIGHVVVLGYLASVVASAVEGAALTGGLGALGAALFSIGIPRDSVVEYEEAIKADGFLVMVHGTAAETARAKTILGVFAPSDVHLHAGLDTAMPADELIHAAG